MDKQTKEITQNLINDFEALCEKYAFDDIDTKMLRKGIKNCIDNYS